MVQTKLFQFLFFSPVLYWIYLGFTQQLGVDPVKYLNHQSGEISAYLLLVNLCLGIWIAFKIKIPLHLRFIFLQRRFIGVINFFYVLIHVFFYFAIESFESKAITQLFTKKYLIFAIFAWIILLFLFLTSNQYFVKKLGQKKWKLFHRSIYVALIFVTLHTLLIEKADLIKYGILFGIVIFLQLIRFLKSGVKIKLSKP